jgi:hypothetical protein
VVEPLAVNETKELVYAKVTTRTEVATTSRNYLTKVPEHCRVKEILVSSLCEVLLRVSTRCHLLPFAPHCFWGRRWERRQRRELRPLGTDRVFEASAHLGRHKTETTLPENHAWPAGNVYKRVGQYFYIVVAWLCRYTHWDMNQLRSLLCAAMAGMAGKTVVLFSRMRNGAGEMRC